MLSVTTIDDVGTIIATELNISVTIIISVNERLIIEIKKEKASVKPMLSFG